MFLEVAFVPTRKMGKLPGQCLQASYAKEYGEDIVEIQQDALKPGSKVVIMDDLLATGGTLKAAVDVVEKAKAEVAETFVLIELLPLHGRERNSKTKVTSVLKYNEA